MGLIKEPKKVDFSVESKPWTETELADFRQLIKKIKEKDSKRQQNALKKNKQPIQ